jgi:ABC-type nitrate/sulfonate/bicarbonate transport system substrate-binding protein
VNRRQFLGQLALAGTALPLARPALAQGTPSKVRVQLGWIPNVQYVGEWLAIERGFFAKQGLAVEWYPGGPNALPGPVVLAAGKADLAYAAWLPFLDAVAKGNDLVMVAAVFPKNPLGILSLPRKPIRKPEDIVGSKILVQGPNERTAIEATLSLAGQPVRWTPVPAGFSPEPLLAGDGDGYTAFSANQTIVLERMGMKWDKDFFFASFDDLGFRSYGGVLITSRAYLDKNRPVVVAYVRAQIQAWDLNDKDPAPGAKLAVEKYGVDLGLDLQQQIRQNELQKDLTQYPEPGKPRLSLDRALIEGPMYAAARATGRNNLPDIAKIADFDVVTEAYKGL